MASPRSISLLGALLTAALVQAQAPWAVSVETYSPGATAYSGYNLPESALGRPTVDTYANISSLEPSVAVVPVYPPWDPYEIVSIGEGGEIVLKMGREITNDPANPYGVDFLVFGNSMLLAKTGGRYDQDANSPIGYTMGSGLYQKPGVVSVSADQVTWYSFSDGPFVGGMLPTLGRVWTGSAWGAPTDPTIPPDPKMTSNQLMDIALDELCRRYRGGAGGTGFDLSTLVIPEGQTPPPAAFRYVKISVPSVPDDEKSGSSLRTEIDAVTVVSPVSGFVRWQQTHFAWTADPLLEVSSANPDGDDHDNWREFALGGDPQAKETVSLKAPRLSIDPRGNIQFVGDGAEDGAEDAWVLEQTSTPQFPESWLSEEGSVPLTEGVRLFRLRLGDAP